MNKRDFNQALRYLAKGADAPSYSQLKDFAFRTEQEAIRQEKRLKQR